MKSQSLFIFSAFLLLASCNEKHDRKYNDNKDSNWVDKVVNTDHEAGTTERSIGRF
ncbi:hypothetical protein [Chryseobacterium wanjuense]